MSKLSFMAVTLAAALLLIVSVGAVSSGAAPPLSLQESSSTGAAAEEAPSDVGLHPAVDPLAAISAVSDDEPWLTDVRIPVVFTNDTAATLAADLGAFDGLTFALRDSTDTAHGPDTAHPLQAAQPNHSLRWIGPGMSARWTLGFRVPTAGADRLTLEAYVHGALAETWDVATLSPVPAESAARLISAPALQLGDSIDWDDGVHATPRAVGSLVCGDPTIEIATQLIAVTFSVVNEGADEVRWPGYVYRDGASVAQWADGTAADMGMETFADDAETLSHVSTVAVRLPAMAEAERAMIFAAPRDGRFADLDELPAGIMLRTPRGDRWLDLGGVESTIGLSPALCDLGFFGGPIPFSFSPAVRYDIGGEPRPADAAALDASAQSLLTEAIAGAALYYDASGQTFAGVGGDDLVARAPRVTFVAEDVGADLAGATGVVYFAIHPDDATYLYVATRSASGRWFCAGVTPHQGAVAADGPVLSEIESICYPTSLVDEG